jgi:hypothetical protein
VDSVALAATIGGSVVALAGVAAGMWSVTQQRQSSNELADRQHTHERELARGARLFERRADLYERLVGFVHVWWERVAATEPIARWDNDPEPPEPPTIEEWRAMYVQLRTLGSVTVAEAFDEFAEAFRDFTAQVDLLRSTRDQPSKSPAPWHEVQEARQRVRALSERVERLVSEELATL